MNLTLIGVSAILALLIIPHFKQTASGNTTSESYFFANRSLGAFPLGLTLLATQVGGGIIVGICDAAFELGLLGYAYALGQLLGLIFVALFFNKAFQRLRLQTTSEIFTKVYQSPQLRKCASILSVISLTLILVAQAVAIKKLFLALGFTSYTPLFIVWGIVVAYTALGGFSTVVKTDILQIGLIVLGMLILGYSIPFQDYVQVSQSIRMDFSLSFSQTANFIIWPCCYILIEQDMVQRFGASKNVTQLKKALFISILGLGLIALFPLFIGILSRLNGLEVSSQSSVLVTFCQTYLSNGFTHLILFIILMAIISTVDSLLSAISSLISCDNLVAFKGNDYLKNSLLTFVMGCLALLGGLFFESVLNMMVFSYGLTASALFIPAVFGILGFSQNPKAAWISFFSGIISYSLLFLWNEAGTIFALVFSAIGFGAGLLMDPPLRPASDV